MNLPLTVTLPTAKPLYPRPLQVHPGK
jgi:hypothetical protein